MTEPTQHTSGRIVDTTGDQVVPPGSLQDPLSQRTYGPAAELGRLEDYLRESFPEEFGRTNVQEVESVADIAIRVLQELVATTVSDVVRCSKEYCNRTAGHDGECGWVNVS